MKTIAAVFLVSMITVAALAGTRSKDSNGAAPTDAGDGVSLQASIGCRASLRQTDGGTVGGGKVLVHYYDATLGWVEGAASLACTVAARADGGSRSSYVCPDMEPLARFGRVAISTYGVTDSAGSATSPIARIECWDPAAP